MQIDTLDRLIPGEYAVIAELEQSGDLRRRLQDLGFVPGTEVGCAFRAPLGSPAAYWIKGTVVALRQSESQLIKVMRGG